MDRAHGSGRLAHNRKTQHPREHPKEHHDPGNITIILLPSKSPEPNPVENIWQYLPANRLSNRTFENDDAIVDATGDASNNLLEQPETIASIGMRNRAYPGQ